MATNKTDDQNFRTDVLDSKEPVLVDFWAEWCGPCKAIAPSLEELSEEMSNKLKVVKINVDENNELAQALRIKGLPTLMIYKSGEMMWRQSGEQDADTLINLINEFI